MTSIAPQVPRLRKWVAVPVLAVIFALSGAPVGNLLIDQAAAGKNASDGSGKVSSYGRKVRH